MSRRSSRQRKTPTFFHRENFVKGSGSCRRTGYDPTDMTWHGKHTSAAPHQSGTYRFNSFLVSDQDAIVECSDTETESEAEWDDFENDEAEENPAVLAWETPEIGMVIEEKWNMDNGTTAWFKGTIVALCRRYFKIQWTDGTKTTYHRRSWNAKRKAALKIID